MCPAAAINLERYACLHCAGKQAIDYRDLGRYGNDPSGRDAFGVALASRQAERAPALKP